MSGLLFGACCFFVCGGADYFLGRATFLRLGWIRWCGLLFGRGRNTFCQNWIRTQTPDGEKIGENQTVPEPVRKAYAYRKRTKPNMMVKKGVLIFHLLPVLNPYQPVQEYFFGPVGLSIWISGVIRGILVRTRRVFQGCFPVHGFVVLFFGSLKVGGLKLFPLHFGFLFRVLGKLILGYTFPIDRFYETKSEQTKHNEKLDETCIHNTYNIHVFMQMV